MNFPNQKVYKRHNHVSIMFKNQVKTAVLLASLMGILLLIGQYFGGPQGLTFALIFGLGINFVMFWWSDKIVLKMYRAKEADRHHHKKLYDMIQDICQRAHLPMPKVFIVPGNHPNAFATGRDPEHSSITVTTGLLEKLNKLELEGVIAHEMSHIKNYDIRVMMLASVMVGLTILLSDFLLRSFLWGRRDSENNQLTIVLIVVGLVLAILSPFIGEAIKLAISRKREFLADASGAQLTRYPKGLADALRKIKEDPDPLVDHANKATAHLFISTPFRKKRKMFFKNLWMTHPDINERIRRLDKM